MPKGGTEAMLFNRSFEEQPRLPRITYVLDDARALHMLSDQQYHMCFSNSVIEHMRCASSISHGGGDSVSRNGLFCADPQCIFPDRNTLPSTRLAIHARIPLCTLTPIARLGVDETNAGPSTRPRSGRIHSSAFRDPITMAFPDSRIYREKIEFLT